MSAKKSGSKKFSDIIHLDGLEIRFHDSYDLLINPACSAGVGLLTSFEHEENAAR